MPIPVGLVSGVGIEFTEAVSRSVEQGSYTGLFAAGISGVLLKQFIADYSKVSQCITSLWNVDLFLSNQPVKHK